LEVVVLAHAGKADGDHHKDEVVFSLSSGFLNLFAYLLNFRLAVRSLHLGFLKVSRIDCLLHYYFSLGLNWLA